MPWVNIKIVGENIADDPQGKKARIAARVADAIHEETGAAKTSVWVVFEEIAAKDWFVGEESVEAMRARRK